MYVDTVMIKDRIRNNGYNGKNLHEVRSMDLFIYSSFML